MAVTIEHGYTPVETERYVEYTHTVVLDDTYDTQLGAPADYNGVMRFTAGNIYLTYDDVVCDMTSCEFTDTSNNVRRYYVEQAQDGRYSLYYTINNGTPRLVYDTYSSPIYFGWFANSGVWTDGATPGYQANITGKYMYVTAGGNTRFGQFSSGTRVRVSTETSVTLTNRTYEVQETETVIPQPQQP